VAGRLTKKRARTKKRLPKKSALSTASERRAHSGAVRKTTKTTFNENDRAHWLRAPVKKRTFARALFGAFAKPPEHPGRLSEYNEAARNAQAAPSLSTWYALVTFLLSAAPQFFLREQKQSTLALTPPVDLTLTHPLTD
jgi:hypothetical protein